MQTKNKTKLIKNLHILNGETTVISKRQHKRTCTSVNDRVREREREI